MCSYSTSNEPNIRLDRQDSVQIELKNLVQNDVTKAQESLLTWHNINVFLPQKSSIFNKPKSQLTKQILKNISGVAKPYEILAILGSSGAGKSTLLNILNSRNIGNLKIDGEVRVNGQSLGSTDTITSICGYVQQNDLFISTLKVKEHLFFQAMLKMDKNCSQSYRLKRIEIVLEDFNLIKRKDSIIGSPERNIKGISRGEMRRLSFASEILTDPSILFCDEPTSGLDSFMAKSVVEAMKNLSNSGKTIICTIHQPSSEIFEMFDKICFISDGKLAFIGNQLNASHFFDKLGYICPANYNPVDYYIKILSVKPNQKEESLKEICNIVEEFEKSNNFHRLNSQLSFVDSQTGLNRVFDHSKKIESVYKTNFFVQIKWLLWRNIISILRDTKSLLTRIFQAIIIGLVVGVIYHNKNFDQETILNRNAAIFISLITLTAQPLFSVVNIFPIDLCLFKREHHNGMYSVFSYYITKSIVEMPFQILEPVLFTLSFYWIANMNQTFNAFVIYCLVTILNAGASIAFGHFISALAPNVAIASTIAAPLVGPLILFSGCFINNDSIPIYFLWIKYFSWLNYSSQTLIVTQWHNVTNIGCQDYSRCFKTGDDILNNLNINPDHISYNILMLFYTIFGFRLLAFLSLLVKSYTR